jgi:hypothetical protein
MDSNSRIATSAPLRTMSIAQDTTDPLDRLLAETIPTGTFGGSRAVGPAPHRVKKPAVTSTPKEQARRRADLEAALSMRETRGPKPRHLRVVQEPVGMPTEHRVA